MKAVKVGLKGKRDPEIAPIVNGIVAGATGKTELDDSPVTLASLTALVTEGTTLLDEESQAKDTWLLKRTQRRMKFKKMREEARRYAIFANSVYAGDKSKLQAVGLDVVELGPFLGVLPAPANLRSRQGLLDGSMTPDWRFTTGRDFYEAQCAESADANLPRQDRPHDVQRAGLGEGILLPRACPQRRRSRRLERHHEKTGFVI